MDELSDVLYRSASSTCYCNANGECIEDHILPYFSCFLYKGLTPLPTIRVLLPRWLSEYHPSEVPGSEEPSEVLEVGDFDGYVAVVEGEGDWDLSNLTGGPVLGSSCLHSCLLWPVSRGVFAC